MPTEHEFKYLLDLSVLGDVDLAGYPYAVIRQGYLAVSDSMDVRVRHTFLPHGRDIWTLTFKQKVAERKIEIEQELNVRDGMDLWEVATGKIKKIRSFVDSEEDGTVWEVDLFHGSNPTTEGLYFAMAEIELMEGAPPPEGLPDFLQKFLLFEVPLTDDRFSNKKLGDVEYAKKLYAEIQGENHGRNHHEEEESV
jgi:CYTH domain-containing protein